MNRWFALVHLARPAHWSKAAFVLMPLPFGLASGGVFDAPRFLLGLAGFSLAASAVYAFNDIRDAEQDRRHPVKRHRPVASGTVSPGVAAVWSLVLLGAGLGLAALSGSRVALGVVATYVLLNLIYSFGAKHVPLIDVFLLSSGFVLRVLLGCALIDVKPSSWLLLCSSTLALFMALTKRRSELRVVGPDHRPSLAGTTEAFLNQAIAISAGMTTVSYAMYSIEGGVLEPGREFPTVVFVTFGVLEYLRLSHLKPNADSPVTLLFGSPTLLLCGIGWLVAAAFSMGLI